MQVFHKISRMYVILSRYTRYDSTINAIAMQNANENRDELGIRHADIVCVCVCHGHKVVKSQ